MSEFKAIETQEQLDAIIGDRLKRQEEKIRKEYADYEDLKTAVNGFDAVKEEYEARIKEKEEIISGHDALVADKDAKIKRLETDSLKVRIADSMGIPINMADRIKGETEDDIKADAEQLAPMLKGGHKKQRWDENEDDRKNARRDQFKKMLAGLNLD